MIIKALIGKLTYRGKLIRAWVIGSEHDYDRTVSVYYPLFHVRCDESTGWTLVAERTVTREELEERFGKWGQRYLDGVLALYDSGAESFLCDCQVWDLPSFEHLKFETFNQDITV